MRVSKITGVPFSGMAPKIYVLTDRISDALERINMRVRTLFAKLIRNSFNIFGQIKLINRKSDSLLCTPKMNKNSPQTQSSC